MPRLIFRSRRFGHRHLKARQILLIGLLTWLGPLGVGVVLLASTFALVPNPDESGVLAAIATTGGILIFAPIYGVVAVPLGLLVGAWAMRWGIAGWGTMGLVSVGLPLGTGLWVNWMEPSASGPSVAAVITVAIFIHAVIMWVSTRLLCADCLLDPLS